MRRLSATLVGALAALVVAGLVVLVVLYSGWYNVAATEEHTAVTRWALSTLQHNSVSARAGDLDVDVPSDSAALARGFRGFDAMCVGCHGAPGVDRGEVGQGVTPTPPELSDEAPEWTDAELFWIVKHGIKLAGMPAFGPTHSDESIREMVAFLRELPDMTSEDYAKLRSARAAADSAAGGHGHGGHQH